MYKYIRGLSRNGIEAFDHFLPTPHPLSLWLGSHAICLSRLKPRWKALCKQRSLCGIVRLCPLSGTAGCLWTRLLLRGFPARVAWFSARPTVRQWAQSGWSAIQSHRLDSESNEFIWRNKVLWPWDGGLWVKCASSAPTLSVKLRRCRLNEMRIIVK